MIRYLIALLALIAAPVSAERIKDLGAFAGVRPNQLVGYGIVVGLAAQQAPLEQACGWGVVLHALAGGRLAQRLGPLGYLARELPGELPAVMKKLRRTAGVRPANRSARPRE